MVSKMAPAGTPGAAEHAHRLAFVVLARAGGDHRRS